MASEEPVTLAISTSAGVLVPLTARRYMPGKVTKLGADSFWDLFQEPGFDLGLVASIPTLGMAALGADGTGPLAYNSSAINNAAAFGGAALGATASIAMFSLREQAEEAGLTLQPRGSTSAGLELDSEGASSTRQKKQLMDVDNPAGVGQRTP